MKNQQILTKYNKLLKRYSNVGIALLVLCCFTLSLPAHAQQAEKSNTEEATDKKLSNVKNAISRQKTTIKKVDSKRKKLFAQLKNDELAIAAVIKNIKETSEKLSKTKKRLTTLAKEKSALTTKKHQQESVLAKQLRAAYSTGNHDYLKLILNQQNAGSVQRTITYYQYLNDARIKEIDGYKSIITQLTDIALQQQLQIKQLQDLENNQTEQKESLETNQQQRQQTVTKLNEQRLNSTQKLEKLEAQEANLMAALRRIAQLSRQDIELNGLSKLKRKLSWPVKGKINRSFGSRKQGYLKWKGVLMSAPVGRSVKTIHSGTVLFSDWLKGYGLVTVVDHGEGYMSLYGHNQALLKSVGERVETGEPIALVGQSGGQSQSALYFEIRYNGQAVNPKLWCR